MSALFFGEGFALTSTASKRVPLFTHGNLLTAEARSPTEVQQNGSPMKGDLRLSGPHLKKKKKKNSVAWC